MKDFCIALYKKRTEDEIYRVYVTDCLQMISENTANQVGGKFIQKRYYDILNPPPAETSEFLKRFWILDKGEKAPNALKTIITLLTSEGANDFFTSLVPFLATFSKNVSAE